MPRMLARPRGMMYEFIRDFTVAEENGVVIGAGALHIMWEDLAEIRALAVAPEFTNKGIGRAMVNTFNQEARKLGIPKVFSLTYQQGFFEKCGFHPVSKDVLPHKVWNCDENAVLIEINMENKSF